MAFNCFGIGAAARRPLQCKYKNIYEKILTMSTHRPKLSTDPNKDNGPVLNKIYQSAKEGDTILYPSGRFTLITPLVCHNKPLIHQGQNTTLQTYHTKGPALLLTRDRDTDKTKISNLNFIGQGIKGSAPDAHGIECSVPVILEDISITSFMGHGLYLWATKGGERPASDVSHTSATRVKVASCKRDGIRIQGGDANCGLFIQMDVRDNEGCGIADLSFFGNKWEGAMAHYNKRCNYMANGPVGAAVFSYCYNETDSNLSIFGGYAKVSEGYWPDKLFTLGEHATAEIGGELIKGPYKADVFPNWYLKMEHDPNENYLIG